MAGPPPGRRRGRAARRPSGDVGRRELRPGGVAGLDHVVAAEPAEQPRVDGAEAQLARAGCARGRGRASSSQRALSAENIGSSGSPLSRRTALVGARAAQRLAVRARALVLPARASGRAARRRRAPRRTQRLALGAEAHRDDARPASRSATQVGDRCQDAVPDRRRRPARPSPAAGGRAPTGRASRAPRSRPRRPRARALVALVPWSTARISGSAAMSPAARARRRRCRRR